MGGLFVDVLGPEQHDDVGSAGVVIRTHRLGGGVKLTRNRQAAAELNGDSSSPFLFALFISTRILPLKPVKDNDSANRLQLNY